jgi:23S rRNA pseudouridine1911/1915/1917 synthase
MIRLETSGDDAGKRLDRFLAERLPDSSRARIQEWIRDGRVCSGGATVRPSLRLRGGEIIEVEPAPAQPLKAFAEAIPLTILYEDQDLAAINKPAGMVVHAGAGAREGTLVNALLHHFGSLSAVGGELRPGIVHRLDKFTSGVLLVAKNDQAHRSLAAQFQSRLVRKIYWALVHGDARRATSKGRPVEADGQSWTRLEMSIARDARRRTRMAARATGRNALTDYRVLRTFPGYSLVEARIATGRTHQIRVHLAAIGLPVLGDRLYGAPAEPAGLPPPERFFLHSREVGFRHPSTGQNLCIQAPLPPEFDLFLHQLDAIMRARCERNSSS